MFGALGIARAAGALWARRTLIAAEIADTSIGAVSAGVIMLTLAVAAIYTAAPEIRTDPLYGKAYLPMLWAKTGTIGQMTAHPQLNFVGWFDLVASWATLACGDGPLPPAHRPRRRGGCGVVVGTAFGAPARLLRWPWPSLRRSSGRPRTADDDLLLALGALGLGRSRFCDALEPRFPVATARPGWRSG